MAGDHPSVFGLRGDLRVPRRGAMVAPCGFAMPSKASENNELFLDLGITHSKKAFPSPEATKDQAFLG